MEQDKVFSVDDLNFLIQDLLETTFYNITVEGELFKFTHHRSGHFYFTLRGKETVLKCVMFRTYFNRANFEPVAGKKITCRGKLTVYGPRGEYQLVVYELVQSGIGEMILKFEELKKKLMNEGLFDEKHKKKLPFIPKKIGIITSGDGAAIKDILRKIYERFPAQVVFFPAKVQGEDAPGEIIRGLKVLDKLEDVEVIIVGRGGGSLEDLWCFNDELLAREIFKTKTPVISAVGHEVDFVLTDFVADVRAQTPTAAGEIVVPSMVELKAELSKLEEKLVTTATNLIEKKRLNLENLEMRILKQKRMVENAMLFLDDLERKLEFAVRKRLLSSEKVLSSLIQRLNFQKPNIKYEKEKFSNIIHRLRRSFEAIFEKKKNQLDILKERLNGVSPKAILKRGYSITVDEVSGSIVKSVSQVSHGKRIKTVVNDGEFKSIITE